MKRALVILLALCATAHAHKPSDAHLRLAVAGDQLAGRIDVSVRDLDSALAIDDGDGDITWAELQAASPRITEYLAARIAIAGCTLSFDAASIAMLSDGAYWSQPIAATCKSTASLSIGYSLLFDIDAQHRGLVHVDGQTLIIRDATPVTAMLGEQTSIREFVREGVWHIWIGLDHILFLICLILPSVYRRDRMRDVATEVFEIVTAFTLAHSITLVISAVGIVRLPTRLTETAIALSVVLAAVNNITRTIDARWAVAFALGLLHGFGFSSALLDLGLPSHELVGTLLGFNVGVELGQAAIVLALLPVLFIIRRTLAYRALLYAGSAAIALLALSWSYQRFFV